MATEDFIGPFSESLDLIRNRMLDSVRALYPDVETRPDFRQPGALWTLISAPSQEVELVYLDLNEALANAFIQYADAPYLDLLTEQNGVTRLAATFSNGTLRFMGEIGATVLSGTNVSTEPVRLQDPVYSFDTLQEVTLTGLVDPVVKPTAVEGAAGPLTGDAVYQYAYVTNLNAESRDNGFTLTSPASDPVENLSGAKVGVTIPSIAWDPADELTDISEVLIYRSYKSLADVDFSEYKYVGSLDTLTPKLGGVFVDDITDAEFLLIDEDVAARGTVPSINSTGVVEVGAISQEAGLATAVPAQTIQTIDDDIPGVESVTNPLDFEGGSDQESTEALRKRALEDVRASAGAGNVASYLKWTKSIDGIYAASVTAEWYGPGTVKVVIAGANNSPITDLNKIEEVRQYIAGTIAIPNPTSNPTVLADSDTGGAMLPGVYNYVVTFLNEGGGETLPSPVESVDIPVGTSTNKVDLSDIPLGPTSGSGPEICKGRRIYRSYEEDLIPTLTLVTELENNTTDTYSDEVAQDSLPAVAEPSGLPLVGKTVPKSNSTSLYDGEAPIGAHVSIETITPLGLAVNLTVVPEEGYSLGGSGTTVNLRTLINASLEAYFDQLVPGQLIKFKDVENAIHDTAGVKDFEAVAIKVDPYVSPFSANLVLEPDQAADYVSAQSTFIEAVSL